MRFPTAAGTTKRSARQLDNGVKGEELFFRLAVQDLSRAADLFLPIHERTGTVDGFVSLEVSPVFAYDTKATVDQVKTLHAQANKPNLFIKIPGTKEGLPAIEDAIYAGVPVNVTLLFSTDQYLACADAYMKGLERPRCRGQVGRCPLGRLAVHQPLGTVPSPSKLPVEMHNKLGLAVGMQCYKAYRDVVESDRFQRLENVGARPQRLLYASTGTKDKAASDTLYIQPAWLRRTRSTPCRKALCWPSPIMARPRPPCRAMAAMRKRCWPPMLRPAST